VLHAGGKFGGEHSGYSVSGGLHGVGVSVVNALSEMLEVTVWRNGHEYKQEFEFGRPLGELSKQSLPIAQKDRTGTCVKFLPDRQGQSSFVLTCKTERARELREVERDLHLFQQTTVQVKS
jgi:DNA gyrase subunit B